MPSTASATMLLTKPIPRTSGTRRSARGSAAPRPKIEAPIATPEPRWKWPSTTPSGSAIAERDPERGARQLELLERLRARGSSGLSPMKRNASTNVCRFAVSASVTRLHAPTGRRAPQRDEHEVAGERERDREHAGRVDLRLERRRLLEREEDRVAEALRQQHRGDRRDRDRRDDGDAQAADDRRHGERQLDAPQDLPARQPHPARRLEHLVRRAAQPRDDVREQDDERVGDERDLDRRRT